MDNGVDFMPDGKEPMGETQEEKDRRDAVQLEKEKLLREAEELAAKCLSSIDFRKYKDMYEKLERATIDALIDYIEPDPMKFAFNTRRTIDELRQLRLLLRQVENDNRGKI